MVILITKTQNSFVDDLSHIYTLWIFFLSHYSSDVNSGYLQSSQWQKVSLNSA